MTDIDQLTNAVGYEATTALVEWARQERVQLRVSEVLTDGSSAAVVAVVTVQSRREAPQRVLVKVCPPGEGGAPPREVARHKMAWDESPAFAQRYLVKRPFAPLPVGNGEEVLFEDLAGRNPRDMAMLSSLLGHVAGGGDTRVGGADDLAAVVSTVLSAVVGEWVEEQVVDVDDRLRHETEPADLLAGMLHRRHLPGGEVDGWARAQAPALLDPGARSLRFGDVHGPVVLPNPWTLIDDRSLTAHRRQEPVLGPAHGDLHEGNILVSVRDLREARLAGGGRRIDFRLIDLSRHDGQALLAFDPVHLQLSMLGHSLHTLTGAQQEWLARLVVDPSDQAARSHVPGWLAPVVDAFGSFTAPWLKRLEAEWTEQTLLAKVACGLILAARETTDDRYRWWHLRVAAEAAGAYLELDGPPSRATG